MSKANTNYRSPQDEEDIDDLDDVLTDFKSPAPSTPGPSKPAAAADPLVPPNTAAKPGGGILDADFGNDFARELAEGMSKLMREIHDESVREGGGGADGAPVSEDERKREEAFRKAWEEMLVEGMNGALEPDDLTKGVDPKGTEEGAKGPADPFQSSIKKAMEKLKVAEEAKGESTLADDDGETDPLEKLLSHIGEGGGESEEELQGLLESMMTQLMSKDVLYEPLKELHDKFPAYLKDNDAKLSDEDKTRYAAQQKIVAQIVGVFEDPSYSPDNAEQGVKVVTLMNDMQNYGSPPSEIMGPLPPGLDLGPDGLPKLPDGCCIQ